MNSWLLLRGLTRDKRHWDNFPSRFEAAIPDTRVITLDFPGNGSRHREKSPLSVAALVEDCRRGLSGQLEPPFNIVAMSLGAMVAIDWAGRYPHEIGRCVLINTSLRRLSPFYRRLQAANYRRLLGLVLSASPEHRERSVLAMTSVRNDPETVGRWAGFQRRFPVSRENALRQLIAAARFDAGGAPPPVAPLLLASRRDQLVDVSCSRRLAACWQAPLFEHPTAGHDLPRDDGQWVLDRIRDWLDATADR